MTEDKIKLRITSSIQKCDQLKQELEELKQSASQILNDYKKVTERLQAVLNVVGGGAGECKH